MAITKFPDFKNKTLLEDGDYIVGYNANGTAEYRTTLSSLAEYLAERIEVIDFIKFNDQNLKYNKKNLTFV